MIGREIPNDPITIQKQKEATEINTQGSAEATQNKEINTENPIPVAPVNANAAEAQQQQQVQKAPVAVRLSSNEIAENTILKYDIKVKQDAKSSGFMPGIETENMSDLLKRMEEDTHKKSPAFEMMENCIRSIVSLKEKNSLARNDKTANKQVLDYRDVLSLAESVVRTYKIDHTRLFYTQSFAKDRYKISCRLLDLILGLRKEINNAILEDIEKEKNDPVVESAERSIEEIIDTGAFTAEEAGKEMKDWLKNDRQYKDVLKRIVSNKEELKGDKEVLLKFLENKNRLLIANKVTMSMVCDENPDLTLKLPGMKKRLKAFIENKLKESEDSQEKIYSEVKEFRNFISDSLKEYKEENKALIDHVTARRKAFLKATKADAADETLWRRTELESLLMNMDISEDVFNEKVAEYADQKKENEAIIDDLVDQTNYSSLLRIPLKKKIREKMGSLLIFGGELEIADMARKYFDIREFLCNDEVQAEKKVEDLRKNWKVPEYLRDAFMIHLVGGGNSKNILRLGNEELNKRGKSFESNMIRSYSVIEKSGIKNMKLTPTQWKEFDAVRRFPGNYNTQMLKRTLKNIIDKSGTEDKISLSQYERKSARKDRRGIGLSARLLGDQFIDHKDIMETLKLEERKYLKTNMMAELFGSGDDSVFLEYSNATEIKKMAALMRKNIMMNKDKIKELRADDTCRKEIKYRVLVRLAAGGANINEESFQKILSEEKEKHEDKKALMREMEDLRDYLDNKPVNKKAQLIGAHFKKLRDKFSRYENGRYEVLGYEIMRQPKYYREIMALSPDQLEDYIRDNIDPQYKDLGEAMKKNKSGKALQAEYFRRNFESISSGKMTGNVMQWNKRLDAFFQTFNTEDIGGGVTIEQNIEGSIKHTYEELIRRHGKKSFKIEQVYDCANTLLKILYNDRDKFKILASGRDLRANLFAATELYAANIVKAEKAFNDRLKDAICPFSTEDERGKATRLAQFRQFATEHLYLDKKFEQNFHVYLNEFETEFQKANNLEKAPDNINEIREDVLKKQDSARASELKNKYLGFDEAKIKDTLNDVYSKKSLVNIGTKHNVDLSHGSQNYVREHLTHKMSERIGAQLTPMVINLIVEKNLASWSDELAGRTPGLAFVLKKFDAEGSVTVIEHAQWLSRVRDVLSQADDGEDPVTDDELNLMLVNVYRHEEDFFDKKKGFHDYARETIKGGAWYKTFRANYKELKKLESMNVTNPSLEQERIGLSRDLRALLSTGLGVKDQDSAAKENFKELAARGVKYISFVSNLYTIIGERMEESQDYKGLNDFAKSTYTEKIRAYFNDDLMKELTNANAEATGVNVEQWTGKIDSLLADRFRMRYIKGADQAINSETLAVKNANFAETMGLDAIDNVIKKYGWRGQRNKYNALSAQQKELFALALMLMDKSAIGMDGGSNDVLNDPALRKKEVAPRLKELTKFMAGKDYDFKVDYAQAYYKLTNYGYNSVNSLKTKLSDSAFNKAMEFAEGVIKKLNAANDKDIERMEDVTSTLNEAALLGKAQNIKEADRLHKERLDYKRVKSILLDYADKDKEATKKEIGFSKYIPFRKRQVKKEQDRIEKISKRLQEITPANLRRLVVILQNRTLLDKSTIDKTQYINQDKRDELKLMLADTKGEESIAGYLTNAGCYQALITALSFKIKDDARLGDKALSKGNFDSRSFDRKGLIDWKLLENAFGIMDELDKDSLASYAVGCAKDYIEYSGNQKAISRYEELKKEKNVSRNRLENFLRDQAIGDSQTKDNKDAMLAFAGFAKLNERQKNLFFKVLQDRSLLDISKKNIYRNIWSGKADRGFVNEAGRFRLIDEYIDKSLGGNAGVTLDENAFFEAAKSLLSTQVDDTVNFKSKDQTKDILAGERYYVFKRNTAVDWKLFARALQFVNRAEYELNIREGNAELYRSAGELSKYGHMSMDYSILRRNIHQTGNQFLRFGVQRTKEALRKDILPELGPVKVIKTVLSLSSKILPKSVAAVENEIINELLDKDTKTEVTSNVKVHNFMPGEENEIVAGKRKKADKAVITDYDKFQNKINNILANKDIMLKGAEEFGQAILMYVPDGYKDVDIKKEKRIDIVGDQVKGYEGTFRYGDLRDEINSFKAKYNKVTKTTGQIVSVANSITNVITGQAQVDRLINFVERTVIEKFAESMYKKGNSLAGMNESILASYERRKAFKLEQLKEKTLKDLIKKKVLKEGDKLDPEKIANHSYWKESDEELTDGDKVEATKDAAKDYFEGVLKGMLGEETVQKIKDTTKLIEDFTDNIRKTMTWVSHITKTAQVYAASFMDIAKRVENYSALKKGKEYAESDDVKKKDKDKLENAKQYQTEEQQKLSKDTAEHHQDMQHIASDIAKNIQDMEVSKDVINVALQTGVVIANSMGATGDVTKLVTSAVRLGIDFALYAIRVCKDKNVLRDYYRNTEQGKAVVSGILSNAKNSFGNMSEENEHIKNDHVLRLVCAGQGYEKEEELVTDTGMKLAASIAYSASDYNPILENKIMATTVMTVLGLKSSIGKTDSGTIAGIFDAMKAA